VYVVIISTVQSSESRMWLKPHVSVSFFLGRWTISSRPRDIHCI